MSTFNGVVAEFPRIRIDFFRANPAWPSPLACFLSHIHSDHLQGLESLKSPFVYCSAATRRLVLRIEKYPHRMNFIKGILESRKQHYRHLKLVLKAIPLDCPTEIELDPLEKIRVTLFDANHCPGAVMFLIEGDSQAILYTGDIRSEPWWVNSIARNPVLLPYTTSLKCLDQIYLDTTFAVKEDIYRRFPTKAEGIHELLEKVGQYPPETVFHLNTWTLGYEEVWIALSSFLRSSVHIDSYQSRLYGALSQSDNRTHVSEWAALNGYFVGNHHNRGCLTTGSDVRIHSCERGTACHAELLKSKHVAWITPIITRSPEGSVIPELGAGGGGGDLHQSPELELSSLGPAREFGEGCKLFAKDKDRWARVLSKLESASTSRKPNLSLHGLGLEVDQDISLQEFLERLLGLEDVKSASHGDQAPQRVCLDGGPVTDTIHFPFSRHSSYNELCDLIAVFRPADIYPCTVEEQTWTEDVSMKTLFGHLCSGAGFRHDQKMRSTLLTRLEEGPSRKRQKTDATKESQASSLMENESQSHDDGDDGDEMQGPDRAWIRNPQQAKRRLETDETGQSADQSQDIVDKVVAVKAVYDEYMKRATSDGSMSPPAEDEEIGESASSSARSSASNQASASPISISESAFESQPRKYGDEGLRMDGSSDDRDDGITAVPLSAFMSDQAKRRQIREEAYRAARLALQTSDSGRWDDLGIRSVGNKGHCEPEEEL